MGYLAVYSVFSYRHLVTSGDIVLLCRTCDFDEKVKKVKGSLNGLPGSVLGFVVSTSGDIVLLCRTFDFEENSMVCCV